MRLAFSSAIAKILTLGRGSSLQTCFFAHWYARMGFPGLFDRHLTSFLERVFLHE